VARFDALTLIVILVDVLQLPQSPRNVAEEKCHIKAEYGWYIWFLGHKRKFSEQVPSGNRCIRYIKRSSAGFPFSVSSQHSGSASLEERFPERPEKFVQRRQYSSIPDKSSNS
jgi:hypothetical protein